ncbi:MAG: ParA family protein [Coriobacteriia bacterium]|nr:ParA family protein [Coriobacteriia bacterium]
MGLFGSLKQTFSAPTTSKTDHDGNKAKSVQATSVTGIAPESIDAFDLKNEEAEVVEREVVSNDGSSQNQVVEDLATGAVSDGAASSEDEEVEDEAPAFVPFREKGPVGHVIGQTKILAIINQKGGVGKSTTAVNLAAALGHAGKEVLLVDLDPQGNATSGYGVDKRSINGCVYDVLLGNVSVEDVILARVNEGVDILPSTINLAGAEVELVNEMARENRLKNALGSLRGLYDYILIDCPPSLGLLTINALVASDKLLIPIQCEFYALEGVTKLLDSMNRVKTILNPGLDIYGIVMTMYDARTNLSNQVVEEVRSFFGSTVFETLIPRTVKLSEAPSYGQPISDYAPDNKGAKAYDDLAQEVIARG